MCHNRAIYVGGLPTSIQRADLKDIFDMVLGVQRSFIIKDVATLRPTGNAFVVLIVSNLLSNPFNRMTVQSLIRIMYYMLARLFSFKKVQFRDW